MPCEVRMMRNNKSSSWGFRLTGGVTFSMPLTVFEVQEAGSADRAGIRVGDVLLEINGMATTKLALKEANAIIDSNDTMDLLVTNLLDQEATELEAEMMNDEKAEEEFLAQKMDVSQLDLTPPRPAPKQELAQRRCWHPVVLDTNPPPIIEETTGDAEAPHKKILRNFRQAMAHKNLDPSPESPPMAKPPPPPPEEVIQAMEETVTEVSVEDQLRNVQRQLAALCALPAALQKSLAAVSERIHKLLPPEPEPEPIPEIVLENTDDEELEEEELYEHTLSSRDITPEPEFDPNNSSENEEVEVESESEPEPELEPEPEPTLEDLERLEKLRKMEDLNKAWPWGNAVKPVYKISDRYKVPHSKVFNSKIQDIESKMILRSAMPMLE